MPSWAAGYGGCLPIFSPSLQPKPENAITIAVSSRALFRMEEEQKIYSEQGVEAYVKYQLDHENEPFLPGAAFPFVKVSTHPPQLNLDCGPDPRALGRKVCCGVLAWGWGGKRAAWHKGCSYRANRGQTNLLASDVLLPGLRKR